MAAIYTDGTYTTAAATSAPVFEAPLPHTSELLVLRQRFCIAQSSYAALALNTAHGTYSDFKLVAEGAQTDLGEGIVEWERAYAKVPSTFTEPGGQYAYTFIGLSQGEFGEIVAAQGRYPFSRNVPTIMEHTFHIVGSGKTYTSAELIPLPAVTKYYYALSEEQELVTEYLYDSPPATSPTVPTRAEYLDLITDDAAVDSYSIIIESQLERWMGNIWRQSTLKTKAL